MGSEEIVVRVKAEIAALPSSAVVAPYAEPRAAAVTALLVADYLSQAELASKLQSLAKVGAFDAAQIEKLRALARMIMSAVDTIGGEWFTRDRIEDDALRARAASVRGELLARIEQGLHDDEARTWIDAVRRGDGDVDLLLDLRSLVTLCNAYKEELAGAPESHAARVEEANAAAATMERALAHGESDDAQKARDTIARAFTLFVPVYEDVCRAGRFVAPSGRAAARFPMLGTLSRARRARGRTPPPLPPSLRTPRLVSERPAPPRSTSAPHSTASPPSSTNEPVPSVPPTLPEGMPLGSSTPPPVRVSQMPSSGRRIEPRQHVEMEVGVATESNFYTGFTENLSSGGVFIATYMLKPIGSKLEVRLSLPNGAFTLHGTVRWVRSASDTSDAWPGMGIQFEKLAPDQEEAIKQFVATREPLFFED